jgi:16S rRNA (uracil1498-N3)-methyltransferase
MGDARARKMNRPPRFALESLPDAEGVAWVTGGELHHMRDVMRLQPGARVTLLGADGVEHQGALVKYERTGAAVRIDSRAAPRAAARIILAVAIIKGPRMDFLVEKAAELGAAELWPLVTARGLVRAPGAERLARWRRLASAAAKQSLAPQPMTVHAPIEFMHLIRAVPPDTLAIICSAGARPLGDILTEAGPRALLLACGPEGDFEPAECEAADASGFVAAGLGPNRLRSETAALAAVSVAAERMNRGA